jgi:hypothetical protein
MTILNADYGELVLDILGRHGLDDPAYWQPLVVHSAVPRPRPCLFRFMVLGVAKFTL